MALPAGSAALATVSPARLERLLACRLRVAFEQAVVKQGGGRSESSPWVLVGTAVHRAIELCFDDPPLDLPYAWQRACDELAKIDGDPRSAPGARRSYLRLERRLPELREYVANRCPTEVRCERVLTSPDGSVTGRIDLLVLGDRPSIIDHKTGVVLRDGHPSAQPARQLALYAWLVEAALGVDVSEAVLFSLRDGVIEVDVSARARQPIVDQALAARDSYNERVPGPQPATPSVDACARCPFVGRCESAWEELAAGTIERLGWGEAVRGVVTAPIVVAAGGRAAVPMHLEVGTAVGMSVVTDVPAELTTGIDIGDVLAAWGLAKRSDQPLTLAWREGSSFLERLG